MACLDFLCLVAIATALCICPCLACLSVCISSFLRINVRYPIVGRTDRSICQPRRIDPAFPHPEVTSGCERALLANLKVQTKGTREVVMMSLHEIGPAIATLEEDMPAELRTKASVTAWARKLKSAPAGWIQKFCELAKVYYCTVSQGNVLYCPPGHLVFDFPRSEADSFGMSVRVLSKNSKALLQQTATCISWLGKSAVAAQISNLLSIIDGTDAAAAVDAPPGEMKIDGRPSGDASAVAEEGAAPLGGGAVANADAEGDGGEAGAGRGGNRAEAPSVDAAVVAGQVEAVAGDAADARRDVAAVLQDLRESLTRREVATVAAAAIGEVTSGEVDDHAAKQKIANAAADAILGEQGEQLAAVAPAAAASAAPALAAATPQVAAGGTATQLAAGTSGPDMPEEKVESQPQHEQPVAVSSVTSMGSNSLLSAMSAVAATTAAAAAAADQKPRGGRGGGRAGGRGGGRGR